VRKTKIPFISKLLEKRSATSSLSGSQQWFLDWAMGGKPSLSGVEVNEQTALNSTAVFACVRILSETVASLPAITYRRNGDGGKERATTHPLYSILHDEPNPRMTALVFFETLMAHLLTWGNAYCEIEYDGRGRVKALWPLLPSQTWLREADDGEIWYHTEIPRTKQQVALPAWRVLHVPGLGFDGLSGYSVIRMNREAVGLTIATERYGAGFFGSGAKPGGVLEHPGSLSEPAQARLRESWNKMHSGLENAHRIAILEEGMKYSQIGLPPEDSQFLQTRQFQLTEVARMFRVPPHLLADLSKATFSNIEHQSIDFVVHTIRPWLVRWEQEIRRKLFSETDKKNYFVEFLVDGLLRGDIKSRYESYQIGRQNGWLNADDIRGLENLNPIEGGAGKIYMVNAAMVPIEQAGEGGDSNNGQAGKGTPSEPITGEPAGG
jgi:HK97 family phage portal protein